jgi:hypothetical protein
MACSSQACEAGERVKPEFNLWEDLMNRSLFVISLMFCFCLAGLGQIALATDEKDLVGTWGGTWNGGSKGTFELTITKDSSGKLGGTLTSKPEGVEGYTASLNSVALADDKVTIKISGPNNDVDITLEISIAGSTFNGKYTIHTKAENYEVEQGTLTASKK